MIAESYALKQIRDTYPDLESLEGGHIALWLQNRFEDLVAQARLERTRADAAKAINLITVSAGTLMWASPLGIPAAIAAGTGYVMAVGKDYFDTGKLHPLPLIREGILDVFERIGDRDARQKRSVYLQQLGVTPEQEQLLGLISYLEQQLELEARMLSVSMEWIAGLIAQATPGKRFYGYRYLLGHYQRYGDFSRLGNHFYEQMNNTAPIAGLDYDRINAIANFQPQLAGGVGMSLAAQPMVGAETQFGAIPVEASPATPVSVHQQLDQALQATYATSPADKTLSTLKTYIATPRNLFVVATGGSGKGITLAHIVRLRVQADSNFVALWVDPKNLPEEAGYMDHPSIRAYRFKASDCSGAEIATHMKRALSMFRTICGTLPGKTPAWLILDEWYFVQATLANTDKDALSALEDTIRGTVSLLDADHKHIVLVSQSPKVDDVLKGGGGLLANLPTLAIFKRDDNGLKLIEKCGQCGTMPREMATASTLYSVCDQSPRTRAIYFDGQLLPMPELPNPSGYDRDNQTYINGYTGQSSQVANLAELDRFQDNPTAHAIATEIPPEEGELSHYDQINQKIIELVRKKGEEGAKVRDIQRSNSPIFKSLDASDLKDYLNGLVDDDRLVVYDGRYYHPEHV